MAHYLSVLTLSVIQDVFEFAVLKFFFLTRPNQTDSKIRQILCEKGNVILQDFILDIEQILVRKKVFKKSGETGENKLQYPVSIS